MMQMLSRFLYPKADCGTAGPFGRDRFYLPVSEVFLFFR